MNFVSAGFVLFFLTTALAFFYMPSKYRAMFLLAASYLFYATWSVPFIGVILFTTTVDYWLSHVIYNNNSTATRKTALIAGLSINLLVLAFFKYSNFLLDTGHGLAHWAGVPLTLPQYFNIILPLGISFYTFEAIGYLVDVYRGKEPANNWGKYNFYIMYFPHLISGPIIRFSELWPQYAKPLTLPSAERLLKGSELILLGFCFKVLLADQAAQMADPVFANLVKADIYETWIAVLAFTIQIYFDFMGYTHIARGVSLYFNIELPLNFNHPYIANTISNFWERWHISLSRWIRDYLYFPLGGSRCSLPRTCSNLLVTMLLCGAWHGAGWTYILWGGFHGVLLALYHLWKTLRKDISEAFLNHPIYKLVTVIATFAMAVVGWGIFRAPDLPSALLVTQRMLDVPGFVHKLLETSSLADLPFIIITLTGCFLGPRLADMMQHFYRSLPFWLKVQTACFLLALCWVFTSDGVQAFIYFQF